MLIFSSEMGIIDLRTGKDATRVEFNASRTLSLSWPRFCVLCLKPATKEEVMHIEGPLVLKVPYCDVCYSRVRRLRNWKDGLFMMSLVPGAIGAVVYLIGAILQQGVLALFRSVTILGVMFGFIAFFALSYAVLWLLLLPLRLILPSKLADAGVKVLKSKELGVIVLDFAKPEYAIMFCSANGISVPGKGG